MSPETVEVVEEVEPKGFKITIPNNTELTLSSGVKLICAEDIDVEVVGAFTPEAVASALSLHPAIYGQIVSQLATEKVIDGKTYAVTYGAYGAEIIGEEVKPKKAKK